MRTKNLKYTTLIKRSNAILSFIVITLLISGCYPIERNCADFKTGSFEFTLTINGEEKKSTFTRDKYFEYETFEGITDTSTIKWINDCEYLLTKLRPKTNQERAPIRVKILTTNDKNCQIEFSLVGNLKNVGRGKIVKIN